jgi:hypothetical protein
MGCISEDHGWSGWVVAYSEIIPISPALAW